MCNEFRFRQSLDKLIEEFRQLDLPLNWEGGAPNLEPRESIRPTDPHHVILQGSVLAQKRWGFPGPPPPRKGGPVINFRSDGRRFPTGRCLVPADGFYEFTGPRAPKSKWLFTRSGDELFAIAGLVREDRFTLLTMPPGPDIARFHDRQIAILPRDLWGAWLAQGDAPELPALPEGSLQVVQVR